MELVGDEWGMAYDRDGELRIVRTPSATVCIHNKSLRVLEPTRFFADGARVRCVECWLWAARVARGAPDRVPPREIIGD